MSQPVLKASLLHAAGPHAPVLIAGPSLGTSAAALWSSAATALENFTVIAWDLPGHGLSPAAAEPFSVAELSDGVAALVRAARAGGDIAPEQSVYYAGVSLGGAVGLQLGLDHAADFEGLAILCSGARIGDPQSWADRAATVRSQGTPAVLAGSAERWFAPGFIDREPAASAALLHSLQDADRFSYAFCCEALADFDVRSRLGDITLPVLALAGEQDAVTPPSYAEFIAANTPNGTSAAVDGAAHLLPAEQPGETAQLLRSFFGAAYQEGLQGSVIEDAGKTQQDVYDEGMAVRREVLGAAHVDRANAAKDEFTADFQELITKYAWGSIWTRPGLPRTMRSAITLTALIAHGHTEEFAMHVRSALTNGLTRNEIKEIILQSAIYCGVPAANSAFKTAQQVFAEPDVKEPR